MPGPKRKGLSSNHPFSGANLLLLSGRVDLNFPSSTLQRIPRKTPNFTSRQITGSGHSLFASKTSFELGNYNRVCNGCSPNITRAQGDETPRCEERKCFTTPKKGHIANSIRSMIFLGHGVIPYHISICKYSRGRIDRVVDWYGYGWALDRTSSSKGYLFIFYRISLGCWGDSTFWGSTVLKQNTCTIQSQIQQRDKMKKCWKPWWHNLMRNAIGKGRLEQLPEMTLWFSAWNHLRIGVS